MKKKKPAGSGSNNKVLPGWMASYADMFTVLMAFFVLLFAMSIVDEELFQQFLVSFNPDRSDAFIGQGGDLMTHIGMGILPATTPPPPEGEGGDEMAGGEGGLDSPGDVIGDMTNTFMTYMAIHGGGSGDNGEVGDGNGLPDGVELTEGAGYLRITWHSDEDGMLFNSGQARLLPGAMETLNAIGPALRGFVDLGYSIIVEGHTDNIPIDTPAFPSNWTLSGARASTVVEYLTGNWGIPPYAIFGTGRGEYFPIGDNDTPEGRALNRRVEIIVFAVEELEGGGHMPGGNIGGGWWTIPID